MPVASRPCMAALLLLTLLCAQLLPLASTTALLVVNDGSDVVELLTPIQAKVPAGERWTGNLGANELALHLESPTWPSALSVDVAPGRYAVVVIAPNNSVFTHDANDLQVELSNAAHACEATRGQGESPWMDCLARAAFGGVPRNFAGSAWTALWEDYSYWHLCEAAAPAAAVRTLEARSGHQVEVLQDSPLVVAVRGFLNESDCQGLMGMLGKDELTRAHVGGSGSTGTSDARETLTKNMFINWGEDNLLSSTSARFFDIASELFGTEIPYEGQEPINFLHYLRGFEYRPHTDGGAEFLGKRVATSLVYCEAASRGGATVFPSPSVQLRFVPRPGDMLFFRYEPSPADALHAACPVVEGKKSTLTQWYRLGVSSAEPWHKFENWGDYHNPHGKSRWRGERYGRPSSLEL